MPKFRLKAKVEKLDDVAELYRPAYTEKDGAFHLDPVKLEAIEFDDKAELAGVTKKERDARKKAEDELKKFERLKLVAEDEDQLTEFLTAWDKRGEGNGDGRGKPDPDKDKTALELKLAQKELKKTQDQLGQLTTAQEKAERELKEFRLWTPLRDLAVKSGMVGEDWELARLDLAAKNQFGFDEENNIVVLEDGHPSSVTPEKFFREVYTDQRPKFYKASSAAGSGASNLNGGKAGGRVVTLAEQQAMTAQESTQFFKDGGRVAAQ